MNHFSLDILLEFLYDQFAITFTFCFFGSFVKEYLSKSSDSNGKKRSKFNFGKVLISSIFSTFLVCAVVDYVNVELHIGIYAIISIIIGMWGMGIIKCIIDKKFISTFCGSIAKSIANPVLRSAAESASKALEEDNSKKNDNSKKDKDDDNNNDSQTIKIEITNK